MITDGGENSAIARRMQSKGFTLIEVLVALAIVSIGLLAIAALQATGLRVNHGAYLRTQASYVAYDIADRMRANLAAAVAGNYQVNANTPPTAPVAPAAPGSGFDCITNFTGTSVANTCGPAELAQADLFEWYASVAGRAGPPIVPALLPAGEATIACADTPCTRGSLHTITVRWDGDRTGAAGRNCPPQDNDDLLCVRIVVQL
ncbi:MAG: type IV pilus modification protein PilV [Gammaproteobacteria bacterium]|nr:type IV pilus modification protein PilV [Gammaproteobacteria bacterium]